MNFKRLEEINYSYHSLSSSLAEPLYSSVLFGGKWHDVHVIMYTGYC